MNVGLIETVVNKLCDIIRREIAGVMRWYPEVEEEEDEGSPTPGASEASGAKRKRGGKFLMKHKPWETVEEGSGQGWN